MAALDFESQTRIGIAGEEQTASLRGLVGWGDGVIRAKIKVAYGVLIRCSASGRCDWIGSPRV